jgi:hypothetical protein
MIFAEGQGKINIENGTLDLETMTLLVNAVPSEQVWPSDVSTCPPM